MLHVNSIEKKFAKNTDVLYKVYFVPVIEIYMKLSIL